MKRWLLLLLFLPFSFYASAQKVYYENGCEGSPVVMYISFNKPPIPTKIIYHDPDTSYVLTHDTSITYHWDTGVYRTWEDLIYPDTSYSDTLYFTINALPKIVIDSLPVFSKIGAPVNLSKYAHPVGGRWVCSNYPNAIKDYTFDPSKIGTDTPILEYFYVDPVTHCSNSVTIKAIVSDLTGVNQNEPQPGFSVNGNEARIFMQKAGEYRIFDLSGRLRASGRLPAGETVLPISNMNMPDGLYLLTITIAGQPYTYKFGKFH